MRIALQSLKFADGEVQAGQIFDPAEVSYPASLPSLHWDEATMAAAIAQWRVTKEQVPAASIHDALVGGGAMGASYSPALTAIANLDGQTLYSANWYRIADRVVVEAFVELDPTAGATLTACDIALPIAPGTPLTSLDVVGWAFNTAGTGAGRLTLANVGPQRVQLAVTSAGTAVEAWGTRFSYPLG